MKTFTCFSKIFLPAIGILFCHIQLFAQGDTTNFFERVPADTTLQKMNMDAVYNRPLLKIGKSPIAVGGYLESNTQFAQTDGINEGLSFQFRRWTLFISSTIARKLKFFSELEFEDGTKKINIEFAALDIAFHPMFTLRGGIVLNPIGAYNQNHDGPRWDFIDRPISTTTILPTTLSNAGFGVHGKYFVKDWTFGYEAYITNGFNDKIISNEENRTSLAAGKSHPDKFDESNSGLPMFTGKLAIGNRNIGELGLSYMAGVYNNWKEDGIVLAEKRRVTVVALDFNTAFINSRLQITGEVAKVFVDVPENYSQQFGTQQFGGYIDIVGTVMQGDLLGWDNSKLNAGVRLEYADYNQGKFKNTGGSIADDIWAIVPSIAFCPAGTTVFRFNYRYEQQRDLLGNLPAQTGIIQFGISSYF